MRRLGWLVALIVLAPLVSCNSSDGSTGAANGTTRVRITPGEVPPLSTRYERFDAAGFDASSIDITNRYFPLTPGVHLVYDGTDGRGRPHRIEVVTTDLTQIVDGVNTTIVWERDFDGTALEEAELTYYAQDKAGTVWHLGEYSETYDDGDELTGATGFLQGQLSGARAGIIMHADSRPGEPSYSEGYGPPPIYWTDRAKVVGSGLTVKVPAGTYHDVLLVEEYSEQERTGFQRKYYAPGVGTIKVGWRGNDESREVLGITKIEQLDAAGLARARSEARELEARAKMYGTTAPSRVRAST
jgi:hypothetical protein